MANTHTGGCYCGAVEIEASGAPAEMGYCHCEACRHHSGMPVNGVVLFLTINPSVLKDGLLMGIGVE